MTGYTTKQLEDLDREFFGVQARYIETLTRLLALESRLSQHESIVYLKEGAGRRIMFMQPCVENVFALFPLHMRMNLAAPPY
jgi:hypothetical protein